MGKIIYKSNNNIVYSCKYHVVWCPKYRRKVLVNGVKAMKFIKGKTSRILRSEFPWLRSRIPTLWTNSYFCSTVGGTPLAVIKQYIANQKLK